MEVSGSNPLSRTMKSKNWLRDNWGYVLAGLAVAFCLFMAGYSFILKTRCEATEGQIYVNAKCYRATQVEIK